MVADDDFLAIRHRRWLAGWLFAVAAMVFIMVVLGGVTRLTHSGLSIVEWAPATGAIPPLSEAAWSDAFAQYQGTPQHLQMNPDMTLAEFKGIYWWEWAHRAWGRLIGIAFLVPLVTFAIKGWIRGRRIAQFAGLFLLGGLQGAIGWWMVRSGLVDRPDVSQHRLVVHLGAALLLYAALVWIGLSILAEGRRHGPNGRPLSPAACGVAALAFITMLAGGFVAGTDAGFAYNTFPLMDGAFVPPNLFPLEPLLRNFFEDLTTIQFTHRILAYLTVTSVIAWRLSARGDPALTGWGRFAADALVACALLQAALGAATVVMAVPVALGALHQAGAVTLWTAALCVLHAFRRRETAPGALSVPGHARR